MVTLVLRLRWLLWVSRLLLRLLLPLPQVLLGWLLLIRLRC